MSGLDERYVLLGLRLGRHVDGLVDSYVGPRELADLAAAEPLLEPGALCDSAHELVAALTRDTSLEPGRRAWLGEQARGIETYARILAGERLSYLDEIEACYGVRAELGAVADYEQAHAALEQLLPGDAPLRDRYEAWREAHAVPGALAPSLLEALAGILREETRSIVELPADEAIEVEAVTDEPWWAFNYFLGARRSRVVVNVDITTSAADLLHLAAHEVYPGHHTERSVKEALLVESRGWLEETIQLVPTPSALVSEGIAETGLELVLDADVLARLEAAFAARGIVAELEQGVAIAEARAPLARASLDSALLVHVDGASEDEARAHLERWALMSPERAANSVRFVTDPTWRAYSVTYAAGHELCRAYVAGERSRFGRLLTEQVTVAELLGTA